MFSIFYSRRLFAFTASSTCRSLQIQCQGRGDEIINIYMYFFFQLISLHTFLLDGPFHYFVVIVVVFYYFLTLFYTVY